MVNLSALSVKHFLPNAQIYCYTLYKQDMSEYDNQEPLHDFITQFTGPTKYVSKNQVHDHVDTTKTSGYAHPDNGAYFTEGYNVIFNQFCDFDKPLLMLSEDHFFTTGATLKEVVDTDWDVCYADGDSSDASKANGSILGIVPIKCLPYFPLPETLGVPIEWMIGGNLLRHIDPARLHRLSTRHWIDYCGDGMYTNSSEDMINMMKAAGIL